MKESNSFFFCRNPGWVLGKYGHPSFDWKNIFDHQIYLPHLERSKLFDNTSKYGVKFGDFCLVYFI